jgi:putative metal-binding protein
MALALAACGALWAWPAHAQSCQPDGSINLDSDGFLHGEVLCSQVVIADVLPLKAYDGTADSGWVYIRADSIVIEAGGGIDADGVGWRGAGQNGAPEGPAFGHTPAQPAPEIPIPGGGGAHTGMGGAGREGFILSPQCDPQTSTPCNLFPGAEGGMPDLPSSSVPTMAALRVLLDDPLGFMGSPGGFSYTGCPTETDMMGMPNVRPGANGGGAVILEAGSITLDGSIHANGGVGQAIQRGGPGSGAGGAVVIIAPSFTVGSGAALSVVGGPATGIADGPDADMQPDGNTFGGAGAGGLVVLAVQASAEANALRDAALVAHGALILPCSSSGAEREGTDGDAILLPPDCPDADDDQEPSDECGGEDCDDGDPTVGPAAFESCNGFDDDCDGETDEPNDDPVAHPLCTLGSNGVCPGNCTTPKVDCCVEGTSTTGGGTGSRLAIEVGGGLCAGSPRSGSRHAPWAVLVALAALGLRMRWRKR